MRRGITALAALTAMQFAALPAIAADTDTPAPSNTQLTIIGVSDWHESIEPHIFGTWGATTDSQLTAEKQIAGVGPLACVIDKEREADKDLLFVSSGDLITSDAAQASSVADGGARAITAMNELGLDYSVFGNHDVNAGEDVFTAQQSREKWQWLAANTDEWPAQHSAKHEKYGSGVSIETIKDVRVAIIGVMTPSSTGGYYSKATGIQKHIAPAQETANKLADQIKADDAADVIIVLSHNGLGDSPCGDKTGDELDQCKSDITGNDGWSDSINVVVGGHTHRTFSNMNSPTQAVMQPSSYARLLSKIVIDVNPDGDVEKIDARWLKPFQTECESRLDYLIDEAKTDREKLTPGQSLGSLLNAALTKMVDEYKASQTVQSEKIAPTRQLPVIDPVTLVEQAVPAVPVEQAVPAVPVEQAVPAAPVEQAVPAAPVEQAVPAVPVEQAVPAAPVEQAVPAAPVEQAVPAAPVEQAVPAAPVEQARNIDPVISTMQSPVDAARAARTAVRAETTSATASAAPKSDEQQWVNGSQSTDKDMEADARVIDALDSNTTTIDAGDENNADVDNPDSEPVSHRSLVILGVTAIIGTVIGSVAAYMRRRTWM